MYSKYSYIALAFFIIGCGANDTKFQSKRLKLVKSHSYDVEKKEADPTTVVKEEVPIVEPSPQPFPDEPKPQIVKPDFLIPKPTVIQEFSDTFLVPTEQLHMQQQGIPGQALNQISCEQDPGSETVTLNQTLAGAQNLTQNGIRNAPILFEDSHRYSYQNKKSKYFCCG